MANDMRRLQKSSRTVPPDMRTMLPTADRFDPAGSASQSNVGASGQVDKRGNEGINQVFVAFSLRTVSASNTREHWAARARRVKSERASTAWHIRSANKSNAIKLPATITLTRITPPIGRTLDDDNLRGCMKAVRDGVADWLGINDNDQRVTWQYAQRKGDCWLVQIEVR